MLDSGDWSDDEDDSKPAKQSNKSQPAAGQQNEIEHLRVELASRTAQLSQLQSRIRNLLDEMPSPPTTNTGRDDDSHYFESYGYQGKPIIPGKFA